MTGSAMTSDRPTILVIDDEAPFLRLMDIFLTSEHYSPVLCSIAAEACAMARQHQPQVIILDLRIPRILDGRRALREFQQDPRTRSFPVIMVSADPQGLRSNADELNHGSVALLSKSFDFDHLRNLIQMALQRPSPRRGGQGWNVLPECHLPHEGYDVSIK